MGFNLIGNSGFFARGIGFKQHSPTRQQRVVVGGEGAANVSVGRILAKKTEGISTASPKATSSITEMLNQAPRVDLAV